MFALPFIAISALTLVSAGNLSGSQALRFDSPGVLDLAERAFDTSVGKLVAIRTLAAADAQAILGAPPLDVDHPALGFSEDEYGCKTPSIACYLEHERILIKAVGGTVDRDGKRLRVSPTAGEPVLFVDWQTPPTKTDDRDDGTHWYLGRLSGNGYHRVELQFGQDAPGNFLINPANGRVAFVHNGSDVVALAPDGIYLATFNADNPPLSLRVASLDESGPRVEVQCAGSKGRDGVEIVFKGWRDTRTFDLAIGAEHSTTQRRIAVRIARTDAGWSMATSDTAKLNAIGFACRAMEPAKP